MDTTFVIPFTKEKLYKVTSAMAIGKAFNSNGVMIKIYTRLCHIIRDDFFNMMKSYINIRRFFKGVTKLLITLLFKFGVKKKLENWKSISLLNVT
jgi:hypothetical protein